MNNVPFLCTKLLQKRGHYSRGDIIQGRTLFKEIRINFDEIDVNFHKLSHKPMIVECVRKFYVHCSLKGVLKTIKMQTVNNHMSFCGLNDEIVRHSYEN